jgi:hypothetical protein
MRLCIPLAALGLTALTAFADTQVRVNTTPPGATLVVDGVARELAPTTLTDLKPGTHLVVARKDGFRETRESFALLAGQKLALDLKLEELRGLALIHASPTGAEIYIDGAFRGRAPLFLPDLALGNHRVQISAPGYFAKEVDLAVPDRVPVKVAVDLVADSARVEFSSEPAGATVLINGSSRGVTPVQVDQIPSGEVELVLSLEGYESYREKLVLKAGESVRVDARLVSQPGALSLVAQPDAAPHICEQRISRRNPARPDRPGPRRIPGARGAARL